MLRGGDRLLGKEVLGPLRVHACLVQLGGECLPVVFGGVNLLLARPGFVLGHLGSQPVAFGPQLGGVQFRNRLGCL